MRGRLIPARPSGFLRAQAEIRVLRIEIVTLVEAPQLLERLAPSEQAAAREIATVARRAARLLMPRPAQPRAYRAAREPHAPRAVRDARAEERGLGRPIRCGHERAHEVRARLGVVVEKEHEVRACGERGVEPLVVAARVTEILLEGQEARPRKAWWELLHRAIAGSVVDHPGDDPAIRRRLEARQRLQAARRILLAVPVEHDEVHAPHRRSVMEKSEPVRYVVVPLPSSGSLGGAGLAAFA